MPAKRIAIQDFIENAQGELILDVRSPGEYGHACMPGARSLPLFSDEERKVVGTAYKKESREKAIRIGLDYFGPKMRPMVEQVEEWLKGMGIDGKAPSRKVFVYCWRGGMRSGAVSWLLDLYGFEVYTLNGGYKAFRNWALHTFTLPYRLTILGGYTGSGKTQLIEALQHSGEAVIDLEGLACHKGSAFGRTEVQQPSQEAFENNLALDLWKRAIQTGQWLTSSPSSLSGTIWLEDESQRIGMVNIPGALWQTMRQAPVWFLDIPFEERLNFIREEYGHLSKERLMGGTVRISRRLGPLETKQTLAFLEEGNTGEAFRILLQYYDKRYSKGLHNRNDLSSLLTRISCPVVSTQNVQALLNQYQTL